MSSDVQKTGTGQSAADVGSVLLTWSSCVRAACWARSPFFIVSHVGAPPSVKGAALRDDTGRKLVFEASTREYCRTTAPRQMFDDPSSTVLSRELAVLLDRAVRSISLENSETDDYKLGNARGASCCFGSFSLVIVSLCTGGLEWYFGLSGML